ncbi:MAG: UDP-N-acetylglucosamine--N-acetylmuramyl-(pentapeptide) pyrophosphoryl-undecaprenol N-acetylglucosamine transferase, partial [Methylococcales bacterium]|nr:UDP-N-acetylglucosamine--N-acetylmuramyl-(pentapeptide) pyrophosphoryl-undecaprenol N-acetylglucosamine transferase [Methylococcales bacterium]
ALAILRRRKPAVVLGMGGFVAAPGGIMAKLLGIPLVIHEQNRVVGTTNILLSKIATRKLEAFPHSFPPKMRALCTGNPLRAAFMQHTPKLDKKPEEVLKIAVIGGSQGAKILNTLLPQALAKIENVIVKHQTGSVMQADVELAYQTLNINAEVFAFIDNMPAIYQWADLVICRAGAMTVSEVSACGLPAIFIPLPHAIDDHQSANARYLADDHAALLLPQKKLTVNSLVTAIHQVSTHLEIMSKKSKNKARLAATKTVADICIEVAR